jgi:hypothetical protein
LSSDNQQEAHRQRSGTPLTTTMHLSEISQRPRPALDLKKAFKARIRKSAELKRGAFCDQTVHSILLREICLHESLFLYSAEAFRTVDFFVHCISAFDITFSMTFPHRRLIAAFLTEN